MEGLAFAGALFNLKNYMKIIRKLFDTQSRT